ncbi:hypothetical protein AVEN_222170-1 [Araneus ventricosus]|uniref:Uncharacterized protein n=1 Tax=Araneus ventricosus TaxID=182803 RepID=A0A4Y2FU01_ARAVE|nr:hypothetical protein AVEN_222170-1 [Araneus ventricosus]
MHVRPKGLKHFFFFQLEVNDYLQRFKIKHWATIRVDTLYIQRKKFEKRARDKIGRSVLNRSLPNLIRVILYAVTQIKVSSFANEPDEVIGIDSWKINPAETKRFNLELDCTLTLEDQFQERSVPITNWLKLTRFESDAYLSHSRVSSIKANKLDDDAVNKMPKLTLTRDDTDATTATNRYRQMQPVDALSRTVAGMYPAVEAVIYSRSPYQPYSYFENRSAAAAASPDGGDWSDFRPMMEGSSP